MPAEFKEFGDLSSWVAACSVHEKLCNVDSSAPMAIAGYSCKDVSSLNSGSNKDVLSKRLGSSGRACANPIGYLQASTPNVAILGNVPEMGK